MKKPLVFGLVAGVLGLAAACMQSQPAFDRSAFLASVGERVAIASYADFATRAVTLRDAAGQLCAEPSVASLEAARAQWRDARRPWKRAEPFNFGPYTDEPWRVGPKLDFWPVRAANVDELLAGSQAVDAAAVAVLGAHLKGLPVLEYLLFADGPDLAATLARFTDPATGARRCAYLLGVANEVVVQADRMVDAWRPEVGDYAGRLARSGQDDGAIHSQAAAFSEVVNRMIFTVENVREIKIGKPRGRATGGVDVTLVESRFSGNSAQDILDGYDGVEAIYRGSLVADDAGAVGLQGTILELRPDLDPRFFETLDAARSATAAIPVPLAEALTSHPDEVEAAYQAALALHRFLAVELAQALSVTVAFNDTDGD